MFAFLCFLSLNLSLCIEMQQISIFLNNGTTCVFICYRRVQTFITLLLGLRVMYVTQSENLCDRRVKSEFYRTRERKRGRERERSICSYPYTSLTLFQSVSYIRYEWYDTEHSNNRLTKKVIKSVHSEMDSRITLDETLFFNVIRQLNDNST